MSIVYDTQKYNMYYEAHMEPGFTEVWPLNDPM